MRTNPEVRDIVASVAAKIKTSEANNATFDYLVYQASNGYQIAIYLEARSLFEQQKDYVEINKAGSYRARCELAEAVVRMIN